MLSDHVAEWITRPLAALGNKLTERSESEDDSVHSAVGLGVATGLLWAPCAGPVLGPLLTGATLKGASVDGATQWLNSPPLTARSLRGEVVLVDFWTYSVCNQAWCSYATCSLESAQ
ncbi:hypothetical protein [Paraburkholderia sp. GAS334]|uniref:hypothetical protein n=1 Tax=Paraburkholderia sp. GAS334 TaxID=3035131 RepID=UPI003D1962A2